MMLEGIRYRVIEDSAEIQRFVLAVCEDEWDPEDFEQFGSDLYDHHWELERVLVAKIQVLLHQLESPEFVADVTPRIEQQRLLHRNGEPIPPLILRGDDYLIFDGYARWHLFNELGTKECLAYVSSGGGLNQSRESFVGHVDGSQSSPSPGLNSFVSQTADSMVLKQAREP